MDRREVISYFAALSLPVSTTLSLSKSTIRRFDNDQSKPKRKRRKDDWYGDIEERGDDYILFYNEFPNPVVRENRSGEASLSPKLTDSGGIFAEYDRHQTSVRVKKSAYMSRSQSVYRGSFMNFDAIFNRVVSGDEGVEIVDELVPNSTENKLFAALRFTQDIEYRKDKASTGNFDYVRYPCETLVDGCGDCQDKVVLFAHMASQMGYDVGYAFYPGHVTALLKRSNIPSELLPLDEATITVGGTKYVSVESTKRFDIGYMLYSKENLIMTYTEDIKLFDLSKIEDHIQYSVDRIE